MLVFHRAGKGAGVSFSPALFCFTAAGKEKGGDRPFAALLTPPRARSYYPEPA
jgi:hypothetical protein